MPPEELRDRILAFLAGCRHQQPVLKETATEVMPIDPERFSLQVRSGKVLLEAWNDARSIVRRITEIRRESPTELILAYQRFGRGQGQIRLLASAKRVADLERESGRGAFAESLRKFTAHLFPGWKLEEVHTERDLERSFSASVARAVLRRGQELWAIAGAAAEEGEVAAASALTQGLAWLHWLRESNATRRPGRRAPGVVAGLKLFLPERYVAATAMRWPLLNRAEAVFELFQFTPGGEASLAQAVEYANLTTEIPGPSLGAPAAPEALALLRRLSKLPAVALAPRLDAGVAGRVLSCHIHGLEFARCAGDGVLFGHGDQWQALTPESLPQAEKLAGEIAEFRSAESPDRRHKFYTARAERWLESLLARDIAILGGELDPAFLYSQVPAIAGRERGIIDLLAVTRAGRLVVIELKAAPDPNLPLQALDYWMRVKWHLERGEFRRLGYFGGRELSSAPPLLWLVAPVFEFHSLTDVVLRYVSPQIPVRRIGLNHNWRAGIQVVERR